MTTFVARRVRAFSGWWRAPSSRRDRTLGAFVGALGGFWIGVLLSVSLMPSPVSFSTVGLAGLASAVSGLLLGIAFPKVTTLVCFPFSVFGMGGGT
ncbi:hypothetical protein [Piscinibacter gummiphilus]|uniref:Uncharacterized protein n=1 Tax=Piscinibacter gummiphilus TaxID=946333 RepID=A0A1W6LDF1_9BURK|nr:hypothetical protein [Piscinibacter gummiphilus]ARN22259.1 hypothetical protein A4W93_21455 [Piscinibacter gummiphilus]ATU66948.1 hypothetical protein CPZ87_21555 [Piscinibacter gummiphilus]